jgi:hypothetical protein
MEPVRANFLPHPELAKRRPLLQDYLAELSRAITPANFLSVSGGHVQQILQDTFQHVGADEGSVWLLDNPKTHLIAAYNSGPDAETIVGFKQPLTQGIVSMVAATEQPVVENQVFKNAEHSPNLDRIIHKTTYAMMVVPFYILEHLHGVVSCVQLTTVKSEDGRTVLVGDEPPGFRRRDLDSFRRAVSVVSELIDFRLYKQALGWV